MELLGGRPVADAVDRVTRELLASIDPPPRLAVVLPSGDPASLIYSRSKVRKGSELGLEVELIVPDDTKGEWLAHVLEKVRDADAILLERPLPPGTDPLQAGYLVPPLKDVEGMHPENQGLILLGRPRFVPPTVLGVLMLMHHHGIEAKGRRVAVIGRGANVGRPLSVMLSQKAPWGDATVTLLHSRSPYLQEVLSRSDIVISAVGSAGSVKLGMVRDDAVLIDVGLSEDRIMGRMVGDVDPAGMEATKVRMTPTPGGTGPVTVSCMFANVLRARMLSLGQYHRTGHEVLDAVYEVRLR